MNLLTGRDIAMAHVEWDPLSGTIRTSAVHGFDSIYDNSAVRNGEVFLVLDDEANPPGFETLITATPCRTLDLYNTDPNYFPNGLLLPLLIPPGTYDGYGTQGRPMIKVNGFSVTLQVITPPDPEQVIIVDQIPFTILVQRVYAGAEKTFP